MIGEQNELEAQKKKIEEEKFRKVIDQLVHDIRSPLASLSIMVKYLEGAVPEEALDSLKSIATSINGTLDNFTSTYKKELTSSKREEPQSLMVALVLMQILSEKEYQYRQAAVKLSYHHCSDSAFTFIKVEPSAFKRMISNLVNNAVDAVPEDSGKIDIQLSLQDNYIKITIKDNGMGMPQAFIDKILAGAPIHPETKDHRGIGFIQIMETLKRNQGKIEINSKIGEGTEIILNFPSIEAPEWLVKKITPYKGDTVVVLDDDSSIHHAWDLHFKRFYQDVTVKHFTLGDETVSFINNYPQKEKIFLLADFELINQDLNGIQVIEKTGVKKVVLVTNHHSNVVIQDLAAKDGIKILPKPLAGEIPIEIGSNSFESYKSKENGCDVKLSSEVTNNQNPLISPEIINGSEKTELVFVDDDEAIIDSIVMLFKGRGKNVDAYCSPDMFLQKLSEYSKKTKIFLDNDFKSKINGIELAQHLYEKGYNNLYLFSGKDFAPSEIPEYLQVILKTDTDKLLSLID
jgi:FixJ family two-component response regulator